jgi:nucleoside-diphosphate-sugar epimerase
VSDLEGGAVGGHAGRPRTARCLVTGATGFIGSHVVRRLVLDGYEVRCLVRATSDISSLAGLDLGFVRGDLTDAPAVAGAAAGCDVVVHCGALVSDWAAVDEIRRINVGGTRNVVEAARAASVRRVVHISTTDVYGYPGGRGVDERQPEARFANWYAQSKREAEAEVRLLERQAGPEVVILRPATVYGPGSKEVVGEMAKAIRRRQMLMIDGGRAIAGLVYIENVVDAVMLALGDTAAGEVFNVTDGLDVTWKRFLADIAAGLGCAPPRWSIPYNVAGGIGGALEHGYRAVHRLTGLTSPALLSRQAVNVLGRDQDFSSLRIRERLGWEPRVTYAAGLEDTLAWLRDEYLPTLR